VREYLGKPGCHSSQQEMAKHQAFFDVVQAEQGGVSLAEAITLGTASQGESSPLVVEP